MIHNIVTDNNGDEHQAVLDDRSEPSCVRCSMGGGIQCKASEQKIPNSDCTAAGRKDGVSAIYKRRIKIGDVKR